MTGFLLFVGLVGYLWMLHHAVYKRTTASDS